MWNETQVDTIAPPHLVEQQLLRIQSSPHFSHSRRYPSFLSYVVHKTLTGCQDDLKERTIGVEAFGRSPNYDLNADPVVRVTAGEVRKRLAQYYYQPEHLDELRIELRPGSYIPEFKLAPGQPVAPSVEEPVPLEPALTPAEVLPVDEPPRQIRTFHRSRTLILASAGGLLVLATILLAGTYLHTSAVKLFWGPILTNHEPVLISVGSVLALTGTQASSAGDASVGGHPLHSDPVALADTVAMAKIQEVLAQNNRAINVQSSAQTSFSDLQKGPIVLISGFNNPWTMRLTEPMRFHFVRPSVDTFEIQDRVDPKRKWSVFTSLALNKVTDDYGLIARFYDPLTEQIVVVAAGVGENGTIAAAEVLSDDRSLEDLKHDHLMPGEKANFEAVIQVRMIDGKPGRAKIVATHTW